MSNIREGDLYRRIEVGGILFEIRYGYATEEERLRGWEPDPIYPNFTVCPQYSVEGIPLVTAFQDACEHYRQGVSDTKEHWCNDCAFFQKGTEGIGLCACPQRQRRE